MIQGDGLVLRPWRASDVEVLTAAYADPDIQRWHARSLTRDEAQDWILSRSSAWQDETAADWAVLSGAEVAGRVALKRIELADGIAEIGYWVLPSARRMGIASRSVGALSAWALDDVGLHRIELMHSTRNPASCRVAVQAGYQLEGVKRQECLHGDGWHDMCMHARLKTDAH